MATASSTTEEVVTRVEEDRIVLTLTPEEASTLLMITRMISGDPCLSRRKHTDSIGEALRDAGVEARWQAMRDDAIAFGSIIFYNEEV